MPYEFEVKTVDPRPAATIRTKTTPDQIASTMDELLPAIWGYLAEQGAQPAGPPFTIYHAYGENEIDLECGMPVATPITGQGRVQAAELPGGKVVVTNHYGPYDTLMQAYNALADYLQADQFTTAGPPWEVYWTDPSAEPDPAQWRTEIFWPVA